MQTSAIFFDGQSARDNPVTLHNDNGTLVFSGPAVAEKRWTAAGLHPVDPPAQDQPFRITHDDHPGARLVVRDAAFVNALVAANPHLKGGYSWSHLRQVAAWTVGGIAVAVALGYIAVALLPQRVAHILPDAWRNRVGAQVVKSIVADAKQCHSPAGDAAKSAMVAAIAEGNPNLPPISFEVYDLPILNAFAAPGGKIVFTREILQKADSPDEIAGVLTHEIGHVYHRHSEAQLVRLTGVQVLISVITGTDGGNTTSNIAALATLLRYSREAEREADAYAREAMNNAAINPIGLKAFFEKLIKLEKPLDDPSKADTASSDSALGKLGSLFSTHPGTEDRIKEIQPLPAGITPVAVLTPDQWTALQNICD
jgi:beta-barrel assembly-enhancing protease